HHSRILHRRILRRSLHPSQRPFVYRRSRAAGKVSPDCTTREEFPITLRRGRTGLTREARHRICSVFAFSDCSGRSTRSRPCPGESCRSLPDSPEYGSPSDSCASSEALEEPFFVGYDFAFRISLLIMMIVSRSERLLVSACFGTF